MGGVQRAVGRRRTVPLPSAVIVALLAFIAASLVLAGTFSVGKLWSAAGLLTVILVTGELELRACAC